MRERGWDLILQGTTAMYISSDASSCSPRALTEGEMRSGIGRAWRNYLTVSAKGESAMDKSVGSRFIAYLKCLDPAGHERVLSCLV